MNMLSQYKETMIKTSLKSHAQIFDNLMKTMNSLLEKTHIKAHTSFACDLSLLDCLPGQLEVHLSYSFIRESSINNNSEGMVSLFHLIYLINLINI